MNVFVPVSCCHCNCLLMLGRCWIYLLFLHLSFWFHIIFRSVFALWKNVIGNSDREQRKTVDLFEYVHFVILIFRIRTWRLLIHWITFGQHHCSFRQIVLFISLVFLEIFIFVPFKWGFFFISLFLMKSNETLCI